VGRIAICQVDGKWPNLALAKLTAWHRARGDTVEWFNALDTYDRVYASKVFRDTPNNPYLPMTALVGGTGYAISADLPPEIESTRPDFSLWPHWHKSMGFTTRGCIRHCPFCVVPEKEGKLRIVAEFGDVWDGKSAEVIFLDNNAVAAPFEHFAKVCGDAARAGVTFSFNGGLDARLLTAEHVAAVAHSPYTHTIHMAFDSLADEAAVRSSIALWKAGGVNTRSRLVVYVLVGFNTTEEEDLYRIELLASLGANPFVMPFDRHDAYQRNLARWVNSVRAFRSCSWQKYRKTAVAP
jgi:hypothetical protein